MPILNVVEEMMSRNFLSIFTRATYVRFTGVMKMIMKNQGIHSLFKRHWREAPAAKTLDSTPLNDCSINIFSNESIYFMFQAADAFIKNDLEHALFRATSCNRPIGAPLDKLHTRHVNRDQDKSPAFAPFLGTKI